MSEIRLNDNEKKIVDLILTEDLSENAVGKIVHALELKKYLVTAVLPKTPESISFGKFLRKRSIR